jgi:peptidoglycan/xylan/chitin deacetylase (PgdA/CDA1 family)
VGGVSWLDPLREALDTRDAPATFFLRDDDAGWDDDALFTLVDLVAERGLPLDLAVIPAELRPGLAARLLERRAQAELGLHQHGLAHRNHEPTGRKCEFGPARDRRAQRRDIAAGRALLADLLGDAVDPIFTPPWNRCTRDTGAVLAEVGFVALSRERRAEPLGIAGLAELPVAVDWSAARRRPDTEDLGTRLARATSAPGPVGIMFHHAEMDASDRERAGELLGLLAAHPHVAVRPMRSLITAGRRPHAQTHPPRPSLHGDRRLAADARAADVATRRLAAYAWRCAESGRPDS